MARELTQEEKLAEYEKMKERQAKQYKRQAAKAHLYIEKAKAAGITVTDAEIDEYLSSK